MRKNRNKWRRGKTTLRDEPAEKRIKIGDAEWKRVLQIKDGGDKRKEDGNKENNEETQPTKRRRKKDIRNCLGETKAEEGAGENKANENEEDRGEKGREQQQENEKRTNEGDSELNMEQEGATYGAWEEGTFMEEDFWDKYIEKRRLRIEAEEEERESK